MEDRHILLNNWVWQVFEENKDMTLDKLVDEFKRDLPSVMASTLRKEIELLRKEVEKI